MRSGGSAMETVSDAEMGLALREAVRNGEIRPVFQPIVFMDGRKLVGFEILARWDSPKLGHVSPSIFIPQAEEDGLINELTRKLIRDASTDAARWQGNFLLGLNVSPTQFRYPNLYDLVVEATSETGFCLKRLFVEITENAVFSHKDEVSVLIEKLGSLGVDFVLDDFGTGYSNLLRLQTFPVKWIKIAANFVRLIEENESSRTIVASVIALGNSLGVSLVAEGVETETQAGILQELGCQMGQGWLFGEPLSSSEAEKFSRLNAS